MNLLVTGGCGFIGSNFVHYILDNYPEYVLVNVDKLTYAGNPLNLSGIEEKHQGRRYFFEQADIADKQSMEHIFEHYQVDAVLNFAAESHVDRSIDDPDPFLHTNVLGTQVLLECARRQKTSRFVQISTDEVYGSLGPEGKFHEQYPLTPNSPYAASKASADLMVRAYVQTYALPAIITRCSNNYGPFQFPEKLIPLMYLQAKQELPLPVYGDGQNIRDWIYVLDHCRGVDLALHKGRPGTAYNFGGDAEKTNLQVVECILKATGKPSSLLRMVKDRPGHDRRYAMDYNLAFQELDWSPLYSFEQGLTKTLNWYEQNTLWLKQVQSGEYKSFMHKWYKER